MENRSMFVGLDVHKETIDVSIAEGHQRDARRMSSFIGRSGGTGTRWRTLEVVKGNSFG